MNHEQQEERREKRNKRRGLWFSFYFNGMVLGAALLPFLRSTPPDPPPPVIEVQFVDLQPERGGASKSKAAKSKNVSEDPKPPKSKPVEQLEPRPQPEPIPVPERPQPKPVITTPEPNPPIVTAPEPVIVDTGEPSDRNEAGSASEASDREESGSANGKSDSGSDGSGVTEGSGDGNDSGDGVLKRKPVYRVDVKKLGGKNGRITANICIDRAGNVISVEENEAKTTMKDRELVEKAINILKRYRFERDRTAREKECGTYAFIFSAE